MQRVYLVDYKNEYSDICVEGNDHNTMVICHFQFYFLNSITRKLTNTTEQDVSERNVNFIPSKFNCKFLLNIKHRRSCFLIK